MRLFLNCLVLLYVAPLTAQSPPASAARHVQAAQQAQARHDCHTAAEEYGLAARLTPASGELRSNEAVALYCDGELTQAEASFKRALTLNPVLAAPHLFLGLLDYRLGSFEAAKIELNTYIAKGHKEDYTAQLWLGYAEAASHHLAAANLCFQKVLAADPTNVDARYALGQTSLEAGRQTIRDIAALDPESPFLFRLAAEQYRMEGDEAHAAQAAAIEASRPTPHGTTTKEVLEQTLYQQAHDSADQARLAFETILAQAPDSDRAHQIRADTLLAMEQQDAALAEYHVVAQLNPDLPGIHGSMAKCLMLTSHFSDALKQEQIELALQPHSAEVLKDLGRIQLAAGEVGAALQSLREAATHKDVPPDTFLLLARASLQVQDAPSAVRSLETYLQQQPDSAAAEYLLAKAYRLQGDRQRSGQALAAYQELSRDTEGRRLVREITSPYNGDADQVVSTASDDTVAPLSPRP